MPKYLVISEGENYSDSEAIIATGNETVVETALRAVCRLLKPTLSKAIHRPRKAQGTQRRGQGHE